MLYFENDYCEGAHPAILQKLTGSIPSGDYLQIWKYHQLS